MVMTYRSVVGREAERNKIDNYLTGIEKGRPSNLLILGPCGVGKTTCSEHCISRWMPDIGIKKVYLHLYYMPSSTSAKRIFDAIVDDLRPRQKMGSLQDAIMTIKEEIEHANLLIVLDEINPKHVDFVLNSLTRLNQDVRNNSVSVIIICNDLGIESSLSIQTISAAQLHKIFFSPYQNPELFRILESIVKQQDTEVPKAVLLKIAAVAAEAGGDARIAIRLLDSYMISGDIETAIQDHISSSLLSRISILQFSEKVLLYCLSRSVVEKGQITIQELYRMFGQDISRQIEKATRAEYGLKYRQFYNLACNLDSYHLIHLDRGKRGRGKRSRIFLSNNLENQLEELIEILEGELGLK